MECFWTWRFNYWDYKIEIIFIFILRSCIEVKLCWVDYSWLGIFSIFDGASGISSARVSVGYRFVKDCRRLVIWFIGWLFIIGLIFLWMYRYRICFDWEFCWWYFVLLLCCLWICYFVFKGELGIKNIFRVSSLILNFGMKDVMNDFFAFWSF
jgi:hypothetical protein